MKDILNMLRFDFLTVKGVAVPFWLVICGMCLLLALFFGPMIALFASFSTVCIAIPLSNVAEKSNLRLLYGILPLDRRNIARGRFLLIYLAQLVTELFSLAVIWTAGQLSLYRLLPNQESSTMQMVANGFPAQPSVYVFVSYFFAALVLFVGYLEMMGQIYGRDNEMKVIMITTVVMTVVGFGYLKLAEAGILPAIDIERLIMPSDTDVPSIIIALNCIVPAVTVVFSEITAAVTAKREL